MVCFNLKAKIDRTFHKCIVVSPFINGQAMKGHLKLTRFEKIRRSSEFTAVITALIKISKYL